MKGRTYKALRAKISEVLSCTVRSGYTRGHKVEAQLGDNVGEREWNGSSYVPDYVKERYAQRCYIQSGLESYIEKDEWNHESTLMNYQRWYDYKLRINYELEGHEIITEIPYSSNYNKVHVGDNLYIKIDKDNPEKVLSVSLKSEEDEFSSKFVLVGVVILLSVFFIITGLVICL